VPSLVGQFAANAGSLQRGWQQPSSLDSVLSDRIATLRITAVASPPGWGMSQISGWHAAELASGRFKKIACRLPRLLPAGHGAELASGYWGRRRLRFSALSPCSGHVPHLLLDTTPNSQAGTWGRRRLRASALSLCGLIFYPYLRVDTGGRIRSLAFAVVSKRAIGAVQQGTASSRAAEGASGQQGF
jgi:hypothetical protein